MTAGSAQINQSGQTTTIDQTSANVSINWQSFNVGAQETVDFVQPNASSVAVNRIFSSDGTTILGHLNANGQVFLIDPNGVLFGQGAQVNVGGLVASTLDLTGSSGDVDTFAQSGQGTGKVTNLGTINAAQGGYVGLLGQQVSNQGSISARLGTVALGGGTAATLTFNGNQLVHLAIDQSTLNNLVENRQLIQADGGQVIMTAGAKNSLLASVVNNSGIIEARTVDNQAGKITLLGGMSAGTVNVGGTLDASAAAGGDGGAIETSASKVQVAPGAVITAAAPSGKTGSWLIDPTDFTVAASGGDVTGAALSTDLGSANVVIASSAGANGTAGNVNVNDAVSWSANNTLSLIAVNNVNVNAPITATGSTAGLVITPGSTGSFNLGGGASINLPGATPSLQIAGVSYTVVNSLGVAGDTSGKTLQGMLAGGNYAIGSNIDATATDTWNSGAGFKALPAVAILEGLGHTVTNLYENSATATGLISQATGSLIVRDLGLVNETIKGGGFDVGGILGQATNSGTLNPQLTNVYTTGSVSGSFGVGGLIGAGPVTIDNSFSLASVSGQEAGGLAGAFIGTIANSYFGGSITYTGSPGNQRVGGLVGQAGTGGSAPISIVDSYSSGTVNLGTGATSGGGVIGVLTNAAAVTTISNVYWDEATSGQTASAAGTGLSGAAALQQASYSGFDFTSPVWSIVSGYDHPLLTALLKPLTITTSSSSNVYNGSGQSGALSYSDPTAEGSAHLNIISNAVDVGTYNPNTVLTYVPDQFGWLVTVAGSGVLAITPKALTVSATGTDKVYNGNTGASVTLSDSGLIAGDTVTLSDTSATFSDKNVGTGKTITVAGISISGTKASDYTFNTTTTTSANITKKPVTVGVTGDNKVYDGTTAATVTLSDPGVIAGDSVNLTAQGVTFTDKNVGTGKTIQISSVSATGADSTNYAFTSPFTTTANITPLALNVSATGTNRIYNGTTTDTVTLADTGVVAGDVVTLTDTSSTFSDKNVGNGKTVTVSGITASGADAGNYTVAPTTTTTANITPLAITVSATGSNKVYNDNTGATVTLSDTGVIAGDVVSLSDSSSTFSDKNVGNGKTITVSGISASGADAGNYTLNSTATTTGNITPATVTIAATGANKVYDGTTADSVNLVATGVFAGDSVSATDGSATFADKNVGNGKTVTVTGITLSGASASNYVVASAGSATTTANITPLALTASATGTNKVYNGTTADTVTLTDSGVIAGDVVTLSDTSSTFSDKNVGNGKTVTVSGITASGADAGNYTFAPTTTTTANIMPLAITVSATGSNKVYNDNTGATVTLSDGGVIAGDVVNLSDSSSTFSDKNVGSGKTITVSGISASGADAGNYTLNSTATTAGNITPATVTIAATGTNKVYDGTTADPVTLVATGVFAGDSVSATDGSATFADKNVGNGKTVTVTGITLSGASASNYVVASAGNATTSANITPLALTVSASGANKVYDGTTADTVTLADTGVIAGDVVTLSDTSSTFSDKNVGNGKTVTVFGITASGADALDYSFAPSATTTASITPATLIYVATPENATVGKPLPVLTGTITGFVAGDTVTNATTGTVSWETTASSSSGAGHYAIDGDGAAAQNYVFAQAPGNSTALNIAAAAVTPVPPVPPVTPVTPVLPGVTGSDTADIRNATAATTTACTNADADAVTGNSSNPDAIAASGCAPTLAPASSLPSLQVVNGGIRLPAQIVSSR